MKWYRLLWKYPIIGRFVYGLWAFLTIPNRLVRIPEYLRKYDEAKRYHVGDVVRVRALTEEQRNTKIVVAPHLQDLFPVTGLPDEDGCVEVRNPPSAVGTMVHSLFVARDPWVIDAIDMSSKASWLWVKVVWGIVNRFPGDAVLRPLAEKSILWPEKTPFGLNRTSGALEELEHVPPDEIEAFRVRQRTP